MLGYMSPGTPNLDQRCSVTNVHCLDIYLHLALNESTPVSDETGGVLPAMVLDQ